MQNTKEKERERGMQELRWREAHIWAERHFVVKRRIAEASNAAELVLCCISNDTDGRVAQSFFLLWGFINAAPWHKLLRLLFLLQVGTGGVWNQQQKQDKHKKQQKTNLSTDMLLSANS